MKIYSDFPLKRSERIRKKSKRRIQLTDKQNYVIRRLLMLSDIEKETVKILSEFHLNKK